MGPENILIALKNVLILLFVIAFLIIYRKHLKNHFNIFFLLSYLLILIFFSTDILSTSINYLLFFIALSLLVLSFKITTNYKDIALLNKSLIYSLVIVIVSIFSYSYLNIGINPYGGSEYYSPGIFVQNRIYPASFILVISPIFFIQFRKKIYKILLVILICATVILLIINLRRSAILIPLIGLSIFTIGYKQKVKFVFEIIILFTFLMILYPLYGNILEEQYYGRSALFHEDLDEGLENERRYQEFLIVADEVLISPSSAFRFLFGKELFNSTGHYNNGLWGERPIHVDFNIILHGSGIIGLILYLSIFYKIYITYRKNKIKTLRNESLRKMYLVFLSLFMGLLIISFSGGLLSFSYRSIVFIYMGSLLSIIVKQYRLKKQGL